MSKGCLDLSTQKEKELNRNSIFLLEYQKEDSQDGERDFEFFVFVDPEDENRRPGFLKELHQYLCKDEKEFADPQHKEDLKKWLNINDDNSKLLTPLNWLKIAIERYPYRLFVVIDSDDRWKNGNFSPLDKGFWFNGTDKWKKRFLYKRICWIKKDGFENKLKNNPEDFKLFLKSEWINHLKKIKNNPKISVFIDSFEQKTEKHIPKTIPPLLLKASNNTNSDNPFGNLFQTEGLSDSNVIFGRHHDTYEDEIKLRKADDIKALFYTSMSGVQFQLPIVVGEKWENKGVGIIETCLLNIGIVDERFVQWWESLSDENKEIILFNRLFPISRSEKEKIISEHGCIITDDKKIEVQAEFDTFRKIFTENPNSIDIDILIIHQTIWEKRPEGDILKDILSLKDHIPFVVVTSGRGKPHNLPSGSKFLPFSDVEFFLLKDYPEKFLFLKIIMSLREDY